MAKEKLSKVRELHMGFKMLCESFAVSLKEFQQVFSMSEAVFSVWDTDSNGLIDCVEFFTGLIIFSDSRMEDKIRFLIDLFDFNGNGYLQEVEIQFLCYNVLSSTAKMFGVESEAPHHESASGAEAYQVFYDLLKVTFSKQPKLGPKELLRWASEQQELREYFNFIDTINEKITYK